MEYSVYDLIRILLKKWYVVLLVMAVLGGAAGILSQKSYQTALAEYEKYTSQTVPAEQRTGSLTAGYQCGFTITDMSRYRRRAAEKQRFIDAYTQNGLTLSDEQRYAEAESAYADACQDFAGLFMQDAVLTELQAFAAQQGYTEPSETGAPLDTAEHFAIEQLGDGLVTISMTGLSEDTANALLAAYWQAVEGNGRALYDMEVSAEAIMCAYVPQGSTLTEDALLSQTVMQKPEHAPVFVKAVCKGAAFGFLCGCFGVLLYTFIRDTAPAEKRRKTGEKAV